MKSLTWFVKRNFRDSSWVKSSCSYWRNHPFRYQGDCHVTRRIPGTLEQGGHVMETSSTWHFLPLETDKVSKCNIHKNLNVHATPITACGVSRKMKGAFTLDSSRQCFSSLLVSWMLNHSSQFYNRSHFTRKVRSHWQKSISHYGSWKSSFLGIIH